MGQPAADFTGTDLDGKPIGLKDFKGQPVLLNFWASWCGPCRAEQPGLNVIAAEYGAKGLRVVGVDMKDNINSARIYRDEFHVTYPSLFDQAAHLGYAYQVDAPPASVLIDAQGIVRYTQPGGVGDDVMRRLLADRLHLG